MRHLISHLILFIAIVLASISCQTVSQKGEWTHFRGSNLNGISQDKVAPLNWTDTQNIAWKVDLEGRGWSSPVVYKDQVWYTTATSDGKEMFAVCTDFNTGQNQFNIKLFQPDSLYRKHTFNSFATPPPA